MISHVRALAILQIVYASIGLLFGIVVFLFFGGIAAIVGVSAPADDSLIAVPILAGIGWFAASFFVVLSLPRLLAGIGLLGFRPWGRILTFVVSILGLLEFPLGTAIGIYALWVLTHREVTPIFEGRMQPGA